MMFSPSQKEARLRFRDGRFEVIVPGDYVTCAVTGQRIPIEELRYWDVHRQRAYIDGVTASADLAVIYRP